MEARERELNYRDRAKERRLKHGDVAPPQPTAPREERTSSGSKKGSDRRKRPAAEPAALSSYVKKFLIFA